MAQCSKCGATVADGIDFCTECGNPMNAAAQPVASPAPAPEIDTRQKGDRNAILSTGAYVGGMILYNIPVVGWLICLVTVFAAKNQNRRNFARATLIFILIGIILSVALFFVFRFFSASILPYLEQLQTEMSNLTDLSNVDLSIL